MSLWKKITAPTGANANVLIRFVVGGVFLNEGILKFLEPDALGAGRFANIGLPHYGFLSMVHEARTDFAMWFGLLFLLITGPGRWSADTLITRT